MHLVEVLVRQVSDKALALETTAGAGYSAQRSQEWEHAGGVFRLRLWRTSETSFVHWLQGPRAWEFRRECEKGHREEGLNHRRNGTKTLWCLFQPLGTWKYWVCIKIEMMMTDLLYGLEIEIEN